MNRRFIQVAAITAPEAEVLWHDRHYIHIRLDENFRQYFEGIIMSNKIFRTRIQK